MSLGYAAIFSVFVSWRPFKGSTTKCPIVWANEMTRREVVFNAVPRMEPRCFLDYHAATRASHAWMIFTRWSWLAA